MSKRFTDTGIWDEDWFWDVENWERLLWQYVRDQCDHAGIFRPNFKKFQKITGFTVDPDKFLETINEEKSRIRVLDNGKWFLTQFIPFQTGVSLKDTNPMHRSIIQLLRENNIDPEWIRPHTEVIETSGGPLPRSQRKEKNKDKDKNKGEEGSGKKGSPRKTSFENSGVTLQDVQEAFSRTTDLKRANAEYYFNSMSDASSAKGLLYVDWVSVARSWARLDLKNGKLVKTPVSGPTRRSENFDRIQQEDYQNPKYRTGKTQKLSDITNGTDT